MYKFLLLVLASGALASPCDHTATSLKCVFYRGTHDGDTIKVDVPNIHPILGKNVPIRFADIDAPELNSPNPCEKFVATLAKKRIDMILKSSKSINLFNAKRGSFFRIVADVRTKENGSLSALLLRESLAVKFQEKADWCLNPHYLESRSLK